MGKYFSIRQLGSFEGRPSISHKVKDYFEDFIQNKILAEKKIGIGEKWQIVLTIFFSQGGPKVLFKDVALGNGTRTISSEFVKIYDGFILLDPIQESETPYLKTIEMMYQLFKLFLTSTYKKITIQFMDDLWNEVDLNYLLSLPYPALFSEQKYFTDELMNRKQLK